MISIRTVSFITLSDLAHGDNEILADIVDMYNDSLTWGDAAYTLVDLEDLVFHLESARDCQDDYGIRDRYSAAIQRGKDALANGAEYIDFEN